jgi:flavodoxin I
MDMEKIGIFYGSTLGNCKRIAEKIQLEFGADKADLINVNEATVVDFGRYDKMILGTSTWGVGEMQEDWENFAHRLEQMELSGKKVALFGVGDQKEWSDSFVNGMGMLHHRISRNVEIIGFTSTRDYIYEISLAAKGDRFVGLAIDDVNQPELTNKRITNWVEQLKAEFA